MAKTVGCVSTVKLGCLPRFPRITRVFDAGTIVNVEMRKFGYQDVRTRDEAWSADNMGRLMVESAIQMESVEGLKKLIELGSSDIVNFSRRGEGTVLFKMLKDLQFNYLDLNKDPAAEIFNILLGNGALAINSSQVLKENRNLNSESEYQDYIKECHNKNIKKALENGLISNTVFVEGLLKNGFEPTPELVNFAFRRGCHDIGNMFLEYVEPCNRQDFLISAEELQSDLYLKDMEDIDDKIKSLSNAKKRIDEMYDYKITFNDVGEFQNL